VKNEQAIESDGLYYEPKPFTVLTEATLIERIEAINARRSKTPSTYHSGSQYPLVFCEKVYSALQLRDAQMEGTKLSIERVAEASYTLAGIDGGNYDCG
jgi:hypothetical protein